MPLPALLRSRTLWRGRPKEKRRDQLSRYWYKIGDNGSICACPANNTYAFLSSLPQQENAAIRGENLAKKWCKHNSWRGRKRRWSLRAAMGPKASRRGCSCASTNISSRNTPMPTASRLTFRGEKPSAEAIGQKFSICSCRRRTAKSMACLTVEIFSACSS